MVAQGLPRNWALTSTLNSRCCRRGLLYNESRLSRELRYQGNTLETVTSNIAGLLHSPHQCTPYTSSERPDSLSIHSTHYFPIAMRLFLLPISTKRTLIYCERLTQQLPSEQSYVDKITARASTTWIKWENHEKGWQKKITQYGNKLFARIPFEEWGLKSIPPLSPTRRAAELEGKERVQVAFPRSLIKIESVSDVMRRLGTERQALHKKMMLWSIVGMPISAPVALIPV